MLVKKRFFKTKLFKLFIVLLTIISSCSQSKNIVIYVDNTELSLKYPAYTSNNVIYCDGIEIASYLDAKGECSLDGKVCFITNNNLIVIFHENIASCSITNIDKQSTETYNLEGEPIRTNHGIDIPTKDIAKILSFSILQTEEKLYLSRI